MGPEGRWQNPKMTPPPPHLAAAFETEESWCTPLFTIPTAVASAAPLGSGGEGRALFEPTTGEPHSGNGESAAEPQAPWADHSRGPFNGGAGGSPPPSDGVVGAQGRLLFGAMSHFLPFTVLGPEIDERARKQFGTEACSRISSIEGKPTKAHHDLFHVTDLLHPCDPEQFPKPPAGVGGVPLRVLQEREYPATTELPQKGKRGEAGDHAQRKSRALPCSYVEAFQKPQARRLYSVKGARS